MKCLNRYLVSEYLKIFFGSVFFFVMLLTLADVIPRMEHYFEYPDLSKYFFLYHLTRSTYNIYFSFPLSAMFASSFVLGNMVKNKEMLACYNAGVGLFEFVRPLLVLAFILSILLIPYWEHVVTPFNELAFEYEQISYNRSTPETRSNILFFGSDNYIYYIEKYNTTTDIMQNLVLLKKDLDGNDESRLRATSVTWNSNNNTWLAKDVLITSFNFEPNTHITNTENSYKLTTYDELVLDVKEEPQHFQREKRFEALSFSDMKELIAVRKSMNAKTRDLETEYQFRLAFAFAPFVIVVLSALFAKFSTQSVLVISLAFVIVTALIYYTILMLGVSFGRSGILSPFVGAWGANIIFIILAVFIFKKYY